MKKALSAVVCLFLLLPLAAAHPGQTDDQGGHYNRSTGEYHYHHNYPEHQHENGLCPYDYDEQTETAVFPAQTKIVSTNDANSWGDDGTYEGAYNLGYQYGMETLISVNEDISLNLNALTTELCHTNSLQGKTPLLNSEFTYDEAYESGYYQAETDFYAKLNEIIASYLSPDETAADAETIQAQYDAGYAAGKEKGVELGYSSGRADESLSNGQNARNNFIIGAVIFSILGFLASYLAERNIAKKQLENYQRQYQTLLEQYHSVCADNQRLLEYLRNRTF